MNEPVELELFFRNHWFRQDPENPQKWDLVRIGEQDAKGIMSPVFGSREYLEKFHNVKTSERSFQLDAGLKKWAEFMRRDDE